MFWDKGYTPSQNIEALLEKENCTVEEFLDDDDILQECKMLKKCIVKYFTRPDVIKRLVEIITTEPSEELPLAQRFRHANMACEILTLGLPSLDEKILADPDTLRILYSYLENEPPLNPLLSSFFHKTFCMLFTKKPEQDWFLYQQMCLQLLEYLKSRENFLDLIFRHFSTPVIPELILQLLKDFEGGQLKRNLYEWLTEEKLVERLIAILGKPDECDKHSNVTEFLCDLIKQGRTMRQTEHENDSFEPAFDGSNPILKTIESEASIEALLNVILEPNAQESAIVSGISVVLTLIKPNALVDETYSDRSKFLQNREKEISEQIATTVIRVMAPRLNELNQLLKTPPPMPPINTTAAKLEPPFGNTRLQVCRVFTVLLQTKNEEINKAICATDFFETLLDLFKTYCWNNFLHSEVEKCMQIIFESSAFNNNNNSAQGSTIANDGSISKSSNNGDSNGATSTSFFDSITTAANGGGGSEAENGDVAAKANDEQHEIDEQKMETEKENEDDCIVDNGEKETAKMTTTTEKVEEETSNLTTTSPPRSSTPPSTTSSSSPPPSLANDVVGAHEQNMAENIETAVEITENLNSELQTAGEEEYNDEKSTATESETEVANTKPVKMEENSNEESSFKEKESLKNPTDIGPSALQRHLIVNCKLITKLIDCWQHNHAIESAEKGRRLGYMGYLIKTLKHITNCISESEHIGALIECNLSDETETEKWQTITDTKDGDLTKALAIQNRLLANCNAHEACDFGHLAKDFLSDNSTWEYIMSSNMLNNLGGFTDSDFIESNHDAVLTFVEDEESQQQQPTIHGFNMFQFDNNFELDDDDDDDELAGAVGGIGSGGGGSGGSNSNNGSGGVGSLDFTNKLTFFGKNTKSTNLPSLGVSSGMCTNPWYDVDPFANLKTNMSSTSVGPWSSDFDHDNFADFETHFSSFTSDLGESLTADKDVGDGVGVTSATSASDNPTNATSAISAPHSDGDKGENQLSSVTATNAINAEDDGDLIAASKLRQEYDNNANVEKSTTLGSSDQFAAASTPPAPSTSIDDDDFKKDDDDGGVPQMLVRTLQSVMQESEDDYEDDEGMWTKPLGSAATAAADDGDENESGAANVSKTLPEEDGEQAQQLRVLVNGTTNSENVEDQSADELSKAIPATMAAKASVKALSSEASGGNDVDMNEITATDVKKAKTAIESEDARTSPTTTTS